MVKTWFKIEAADIYNDRLLYFVANYVRLLMFADCYKQDYNLQTASEFLQCVCHYCIAQCYYTPLKVKVVNVNRQLITLRDISSDCVCNRTTRSSTVSIV